MDNIHATRNQFLLFTAIISFIFTVYAFLRRTQADNQAIERDTSTPETPPQPAPTPATPIHEPPLQPEAAPTVDSRIKLKRALQQMSTIYQRIAVISLNTILATLLAIWLLDLMMPVPPVIDPRQAGNLANSAGLVPTYYSGSINPRAFRFSPPQVIHQMALEYDLYAALGHWQVNPWTGLTLRPYSGTYLNIDANGYRITPPPDANYANHPPLTIWAFGGSTMFGLSLPDNSTLPAALQRELQRQFPERQVQVRNMGVPWYFSSQELALFIQHLRAESNPADIALFLDGLNEVYAMRDYDNQTPLIRRLADAWEREITRTTQPYAEPWITFNPSFPPSRLALQLGIGAEAQQDVRSTRYAYEGDLSLIADDPIVFAAEQYARNQQMGLALASEFGVSAYYFWQPLPFLRTDPNYLSLSAEVAQRVDEAFFYDLQDVFESVDPQIPLLADPTHYSDYAAQYLAEVISAIIAQREGENS